nr:pre-rrna-processing protein crb3/ipi3 [Quercus suber]
MLTEHFIVSVGVPSKLPNVNVAKDAAIFIHEYQPLRAQRGVFKKSITEPNCLAVSATHIYAAQSDKGIVHVYNREKGNQENTVPFTEKITCLALACDETVLILGTAEGRIFLWELGTGRQITTSLVQLQAVNALMIDSTSNFLLSASADSTVNVWSLPALLSFSSSVAVTPLRVFGSHRAEVTSLVLGHGAGFTNFAVSASKDRTCLVWDYQSGNVLRTYLLPATPLCLTLDAADRAVYVGYEDGSVQSQDLFFTGVEPSTLDTPYNAKNALTPVQPPPSSRWHSPDKSVGEVRSISLSHDSCTVLSGHESGAILAWDVGRRALHSSILQHPLPGPVNNLAFLPLAGLGNSSSTRQLKIRVPAVVKPKYGAYDAAQGVIPGSYAIQTELAGNLSSSTARSIFGQALTAPSFPEALLDQGLSELAAWDSRHQGPAGAVADGTDEVDDGYLALESKVPGNTMEQQIKTLKAQNEALRRLQTATFEKIERLNREKKVILQQQQKRSGANGLSKHVEDEDESMESG